MKKPTLVFHADWSSSPAKRWCAKATLGSEGRYTAFGADRVGDPKKLLQSLRAETGESGILFVGFDFLVGVPAHYAERAKISRFLDFLRRLGKGDSENFYCVCDKPEEICVKRPFYPNGSETLSKWILFISGRSTGRWNRCSSRGTL